MKIFASTALAILFLCSLAGCSDAYNSFFGCKPDLINITPSPDGRYKAVTRICGCSADSGRRLTTAIIHSGTDDRCYDLAYKSLARASNDTEKSNVSAVWLDNQTLEVKYSTGQIRINNKLGRDYKGTVLSHLAPQIVTLADGL